MNSNMVEHTVCVCVCLCVCVCVFVCVCVCHIRLKELTKLEKILIVAVIGAKKLESV